MSQSQPAEGGGRWNTNESRFVRLCSRRLAHRPLYSEETGGIASPICRIVIEEFRQREPDVYRRLQARYLAQASPGGQLRFHESTINEALQARREREARLEGIRLKLGLFDQAGMLGQ